MKSRKKERKKEKLSVCLTEVTNPEFKCYTELFSELKVLAKQ